MTINRGANDMNYFNCNIFCERAIALFGETGQKELSSKTGISQAVISSIKTKSIKSPSADTIYLLANYFNVSTDWLLGLTDTKSTDKATKELCDTLGLSEEAIEVLQDETDIYAKMSIDWLLNQHINSIIENFKDLKQDFSQHKTLYKIMGSEYAKRWFSNPKRILGDSILWNIQQLLQINNTPGNVTFNYDGNDTMIVYAYNDSEFTSHIINGVTENINVQHLNNDIMIGLKEYLVSYHERNLTNQMLNFTAGITATLIHNDITTFECAMENHIKQTEDNNGND